MHKVYHIPKNKMFLLCFLSLLYLITVLVRARVLVVVLPFLGGEVCGVARHLALASLWARPRLVASAHGNELLTDGLEVITSGAELRVDEVLELSSLRVFLWRRDVCVSIEIRHLISNSACIIPASPPTPPPMCCPDIYISS